MSMSNGQLLLVFQNILSDIRTIGDAIDIIKDLFMKQINRAELENIDPNVSVQGDTVARSAFLTILPTIDQRTVFLDMTKNRRFWPRIKTLVGSPPFYFLHEQDDGVLRASGITRGRTHMTSQRGQISSYASFGSAQFVDNKERDYKIIFNKNDIQSTSLFSRRLLNLPFVNVNTGDRLIMEVRLRKRSLKRKLDILSNRDELDRDSVLFPRPSSKLTLNPATSIRTFVSVISVQINSVQPRSTDSNVARLLCQVE